MSKIISYNFRAHFIEEVRAYVSEHYLTKGKDMSRLAIVFGGKRPALFLKKALVGEMGQSFFPPAFLTIDEFVERIVKRGGGFSKPSDLDASYLIYDLAKKTAPAILRSRETFASFLPWAREILSFIEVLDLEDVSSTALRNIELHARIGYAIPKDINKLLEYLVSLREVCHRHWEKSGVYPRGFQYRKAAEIIPDVPFEEFDEILFCNFFYFHKTESRIVRSLYERGQASLLFQGNEDDWPVLKKTAKIFSTVIKPSGLAVKDAYQLNLHAAFDIHSQVCRLREILKTVKNHDRTVIVLPEPDHLVPLLSEITSIVTNFNISMGYPLKRSSLYVLLQFVFRAQTTRKGGEYYARDYLKVLRHPFVKNLKLGTDPAVTRVLIHKVEEILTGREKTALSGSLFLDPVDVENEDDLYLMTREVLERMGYAVKPRELRDILHRLHELLFRPWESIKDFSGLCTVLENFLAILIDKSFLSTYPLNLKIAERMLAIKDEFQSSAFHGENFPAEEIFKIFTSKIDSELVAFLGSPLKGLQILGLFETRSLNFEHVIIMDVNEGILPRLRIYEPLIPREVMIGLGLDRLEEEEEIQRYQFMRLLGSARNVHLIYQEGKDKERSRFIEELVWTRQKGEKAAEGIVPSRCGFSVKTIPKTTLIEKTPEVLEFLRNFTFSVSSVNTYLQCPLRFYYKYVLGLEEKEDRLDEPEAREVGTFVHELLEDSFRPFLKTKPVIDAKFRAHFKKMLDQRFEERFSRSMKSEAFLLKSVLDVRLEQFLDKEMRASPKDLRDVGKVLSLEDRFEDRMDLSCGPVNFVYKVDRIDRLSDGSVLILDYKTGSVDPMPGELEAVESATASADRVSIRDAVRSFQIPLYFSYLVQKYPGIPANVAFYNLRSMEIKRFVDSREPERADRIIQVFFSALDTVMSEIFDPKVPFRPDDADARYCAVCPFYHVCR